MVAIVIDNLSVHVSAPSVGFLASEQWSVRWDHGVHLSLGVYVRN